MDLHSAVRGVDFTVILVYLVAVIGLGMWISFRKRQREASQDLFLAGRSVRWYNVGFSMFATNIGTYHLIGLCGVAYATGFATALFEWAPWLWFMLLGMFFVPFYMHTKVTTMPQFVQRRFGSRANNFLSYYVLMTTLVVWLANTLFAGGVLISQLMNWPMWVSIVALMAVATSFTVAGGLLAVIITDSFQAVMMIIGAAVFNIILLAKIGGVHTLIDKVPAIRWAAIRPLSDHDLPIHAFILGYLVIGTWFCCTDQTMVQRVLSAKGLREGQKGTIFAGFLKILPPFLFMLPGIMCAILHPGLQKSDAAFMTLLVNNMPLGMTGFMVAVLLAALVSTIDSGLNSFSAIFTVDVYAKNFRPNASQKELNAIGRVVTVGAAVFAIICAMWFATFGKDIFNLAQGVISFFAPPMTAVFVVGILWKRATGTAAFWSLVLGSIVSLTLGTMHLKGWPHPGFWPHYLFMAFYICVGIAVFMILLSLVTKKRADEEELPSLKQAYAMVPADQRPTRGIWIGWGVLAAVMLVIYVIFS